MIVLFSKKILAILTITILLYGCTAQKEMAEDEKQNKPGHETIDELMEAMQMPMLHKQTTEIMIQSTFGQDPEMAPYAEVMREFMNRYMTWEHLEDEYVEMYGSAFTESEVKDLVKFFRTETGAKYIMKSSELFQQSVIIGQQRMEEYYPQFEEMIQVKAQQLREEAFSDVDIFALIEGRWDNSLAENSCTDNSYTITSAPDESEFVLEYDRREIHPDSTDQQNIYIYKVLEVHPDHIKAEIEGETRLTEAGDPIVWDLVPLSENEFCWRRGDWDFDSCTAPVKRCE